MKFIFRSAAVLLPLPLLLTLCAPACASSNNDENLPDAQALAQLEIRAQQAGPRDQCFLYTELVHTMTEIAGRQMLNGDTDQANATLKKVNHYAQLIHIDLAANSKRIKNAEMLMHNTTYKLTEYLHKASYEDQDSLKGTLKQLNKVHEELLAEVLKH
jgi:hypothetical protein